MNNIIAHRGIHNNTNTPENSIKAFKLALEKNIAIELDVRISKDNKLIVFHDENLKRMANINRNIEELLYEEIINTKLLKTNEKIPSLENVLKLVNKQVLLDIEIKDTKKSKELISNIIELLDNYNNFIIKSFNPKIIKKINKIRPNYTCGLLINKNNKRFINTLLIKFYKPDFLAISKEIINQRSIKKYSLKHDLYIWTIKDKNEIKTINNDNYKYICNNLLNKD